MAAICCVWFSTFLPFAGIMWCSGHSRTRECRRTAYTYINRLNSPNGIEQTYLSALSLFRLLTHSQTRTPCAKRRLRFVYVLELNVANNSCGNGICRPSQPMNAKTSHGDRSGDVHTDTRVHVFVLKYSFKHVHSPTSTIQHNWSNIYTNKSKLIRLCFPLSNFIRFTDSKGTLD